MLINQLYTPPRELYIIIANLLGTFLRKVRKSKRDCCARKRVEFWVQHRSKAIEVFSSNVNDHCHINTFKLTGVGSQRSMVL